MKLAPKSVLKICKLSFLALAIAVKNPKIVSETHTKWSQIGAISESWGIIACFPFMHSRVTNLSPPSHLQFFLATFSLGSSSRILVANWKKYP